MKSGDTEQSKINPFYLTNLLKIFPLYQQKNTLQIEVPISRFYLS